MRKIVKQDLWTKEYQELIDITDDIQKIIESEGINNAWLTIQSMHTTAGITVNEGLECLEEDIQDMLKRLIPENQFFHHARMLQDYGSTAGNAPGHLRAFLCGNHCHLLVEQGRLVKGEAQRVYFCEFDGPSHRNYMVVIDGI